MIDSARELLKTEKGKMNMTNNDVILVVDDEHGVRESFNVILEDHFRVLLAGTGEEALDIIAKNTIDLILLDIRLPDMDGLELLKKLKGIDPNTEIIMVTAVKEIETAVKAIKLGAYEYVVKPFKVDDMLTLISRALEKRSLVREVTYLRSELERIQSSEKIIGESKEMRDIFSLMSNISDSDGAVLIQGESGTGKELIAREIHNLSSRKNQPFVVVNSAAIPATLMESEIFGHNRGAFTGANHTTLGKLEIADKGTVFLDDVNTLDISMQAKLLRVIQEKEFERLGSTKVIKVDVRFVAASNEDLAELKSEGKFREDLFYRLNVFPIKLPPLRERKGDICLLLNHFLELQTKKTGKPQKRFSMKAIKHLEGYGWPGNIRELQNIVERLFTIIRKPVIRFKDISTLHTGKRQIKSIKNMSLKDAVNTFEKQYIAEALEFVGRNKKRAAEILGIHRNTLLSKIKQLDLKA